MEGECGSRRFKREFRRALGHGQEQFRDPRARKLCGAPESAALRDFTLKINPDYTVSWHTKGEEIYWRFHQTGERLKRDFRLACVLSAATGYPLKEARFSAGGYKDWCVEKLKTPAFTVEAGSDSLSHPLDFSALPDLLKNNLDAVARLAEEF